MKTISKEALTRRALRSGTSGEIDGRPLNAAGLRISSFDPPPSHKLDALSVPPDNSLHRLLSEAVATKGEGRPIRWTFQITRDANHLMQKIEAVAHFV